MRQLVNARTRVSDTSQATLDQLFVSNASEADEVKVIDTVSDHKMLVFTILLSKSPFQNTRPGNVVRDFQNSDDVSIFDYLEWHFDDFSQLSDVSDLSEKFKNIVSPCVYNFVPSRNPTNKTKTKTPKENPVENFHGDSRLRT